MHDESSLRFTQEHYRDADGFEAFLVSLRDQHVSDVMLRAHPERVAFCRYGGFDLLPMECVPFLTEWLEGLERQYLQGKGPLGERWAREGVVDCALRLVVGGIARMHFWNYDGLNLSCRIHPAIAPTLDDLIPERFDRDHQVREDLEAMFNRRQGLLVLGGEVRSGKTWLENAFYGRMNTMPVEPGRKKHIWILGDPPEFEHKDNCAIFTPIDMSMRGTTQADEIRHSLRVPRSLVAAGEMRGDAESTEAALIAALSGTFVIATGHFPSITDIISRFSIGSQKMSGEAKRQIFSEALQGIINLRLVPAKDGKEILAVEYIDFEKHNRLRTDLQKDMLHLNTICQSGFRPMKEDLKDLVRHQLITEQTAAAVKNTL